MNGRLVVGALMVLMLWTWAAVAEAQSRTFNVNYTSRATFKTDAPLETIVGTTAGEGAVTGSVMLDPARPQDAKGTVRVDLNAVKTGIDRRDTHMRSKEFLDSEASEANRWAVFEVKGVEIAGPLEPGRAVPARVRGMLTIRGKPIETVADSTVYYLRLTPETLRITSKFPTTFTNHGMQVPQLLILKVSNDIHIEADLVLVQAQ